MVAPGRVAGRAAVGRAEAAEAAVAQVAQAGAPVAEAAVVRAAARAGVAIVVAVKVAAGSRATTIKVEDRSLKAPTAPPRLEGNGLRSEGADQGFVGSGFVDRALAFQGCAATEPPERHGLA